MSLSCRAIIRTINRKGGLIMKYICEICGWIYDEDLGVPEMGIEPGTPFEDLQEDFECPECFAGKEAFEEADEN